MATFNIKAKPLPSKFKGTPQQLLEAMLSRIEVIEDKNTFVVSDTQPATNAGPWFKNGTQLWVWDGTTYIPVNVSDSILSQIYIGPTQPNSADYQYWVKLVGGTTFEEFYHYLGGSWTAIDRSLDTGSVISSMIATGALTTAKFADASVTSVKIQAPLLSEKWEQGAADQFLRMSPSSGAPVWRAGFLNSPWIQLAMGWNEYIHNLGEIPADWGAWIAPTVAYVGWAHTIFAAGVPVDIRATSLQNFTQTTGKIRLWAPGIIFWVQSGYARYTQDVSNWKIQFRITRP